MADQIRDSRQGGDLPERVRAALESGDPDEIRELLDPDARWGPPEGPVEDECRNRDQIIEWWSEVRAAGVSARVTEVTTAPGKLLVGLAVTGLSGDGSEVERWQVLTLRGDRVADIRGYEDREPAARRAGVPV